MLQKIMPKTIAMQAYLVTPVVVTVLMAVIGYLYADETRQHIFLSQERQLIEIATILDQRLDSDGLIDDYEQAASSPDEAARQATRDSLQSVVEEVGLQYPGFAMGYNLNDSHLAIYPYRPEVFASPINPAIEDIYREKRAFFISANFKSPIWNESAMRIDYPILNDGKRLGHIWSSVPMTSVNSAVYQAWLGIFFVLSLAWLALVVILSKIFTGVSKTMAQVADKIARHDDNIDIQKVPQLQSVLNAVTTLRNSLQDKERACRTLVENSPDVIIRRDTKGQIIYANPVFTKQASFIHPYSVGNKVLSRDEFILYTAELARNVAATGSGAELEHKRHLSSGKTRHFKGTMVPEQDESGQVVSVLAVSRDITDIKEADELFLAAFNLSPNIMTVIRQEDRTIIKVNNTFVQTAGLSPDTVVGRTTAELGLWYETDKHKECYNLLMEQGYLNNYEVQFIVQGRVLTALVSSREIAINDEPCWLHVATDITEKKRLDAELARLDALNLVGEMAASIGHEVRNPMTTVRGYLQLFQRRAEFLPYNDRLVTMIEEIDRANGIITQFLSLAKNKQSHMEPGNLNTVVEALFPLMQADALYMGHQLEVSCSPIPDTEFDAAEIRQLILNLCRNAMEAMDLFGMARIRTYAAGDAVTLEVSDTGKGIPPEVMDKLGTPFFTTKETGTGLGLAVCYRVAQRHGATIDIDSSPAGTTFSIRFKPVQGAIKSDRDRKGIQLFEDTA